MKNVINETTIQLGVCYYPEHWPEKLWEDDFRRMKEMGFQYVRMAEFAWTIFEPIEGTFEFDLFDRAIQLAKKYDLKVIMGTPTATPPAWLTDKYPEVLNVSREGVRYHHGSRRHYNYNSEIYRTLSKRIVTEMVEHYKDNPTVVGWQIDNEINCEMNVFYSEADHTNFRNWVKEKYQTLDNVNEAWGTIFWNQTYTEWRQIYLTRPTVNDSYNPHQLLDEKRFISDSAISFVQMQADIIRSITDKQWVTTNGMFGHLDNHRMTKEALDFYAYDSYPNFNKIIEDNSFMPLRDRKWSLNLSTVRSFGGNFAIFEQQAGPGGWVNRIEQPTPRPGQLRLWTYQSIAHGADLVLYFRWRTATKGSEIYWHGINDYHNLPNRRISELKQTSEEMQKLGSAIFDSKYVADAAILTDYENEWDGEEDKWFGQFIGESKEAWFKAFQYHHIPVDIVNVTQNMALETLIKYKVLVYPHAAILTEKTANLLKGYVEQGGTIIFGARTGYKDLTGQTYMKAFPGYIKDLVGITVEEYTLLNGWQKNPYVNLFDNQLNTHGFNEVLQPEADNVEVIGTYQNAHYEGKPALTRRKVSEGTAYYYGGVFDYQTAALILEDVEISDYRSKFTLTPDIELAVREKDGEIVYILLNYSQEAQTIYLKVDMENLLDHDITSGDVTMAAYDVLVLKEK
ncbi:cellulase family glycosylhydrolase [Gracilibacillus salitolerans]|uniref:Beta-galactosidase n=1 Tax=Gracilibacillus salitolerans TaxID=2663022 RepID=A0A5Q2TPX5_9BACI|nr:beta-galactosidase [Gracilibacillus salitolerans]QGH36192.1 cellulase family glycosylhydrolase [Gracilibacillus salitolerans]